MQGEEDLVSLLFHMSKKKDNCEIPELVEDQKGKKVALALCPISSIGVCALSTQLERKVMQTGKATRFLLLKWLKEPILTCVLGNSNVFNLILILGSS